MTPPEPHDFKVLDVPVRTGRVGLSWPETVVTLGAIALVLGFILAIVWILAR